MSANESLFVGARVLIVEDDCQVATAVFQCLARAGLCPSEPAPEGMDAVRRAASLHPDLVIVDIALSGAIDGLEAAERIRRMPPFPQVIFLTGASDEVALARAIRMGAVGYILKPFQPAQLLASIRLGLSMRTSERGRHSHLESTHGLRRSSADAHNRSAIAAAPFGARHSPALLTARERQIVRLIEAHRRPRVIAGTLDISYHTVRNHLKNIFRKLGVSSQLELLASIRPDRSRKARSRRLDL